MLGLSKRRREELAKFNLRGDKIDKCICPKLIILINMMTVIRFAINIEVVMMVFMKSCLDQNADLMGIHL